MEPISTHSKHFRVKLDPVQGPVRLYPFPGSLEPMSKWPNGTRVKNQLVIHVSGQPDLKWTKPAPYRRIIRVNSVQTSRSESRAFFSKLLAEVFINESVNKARPCIRSSIRFTIEKWDTRPNYIIVTPERVNLKPNNCLIWNSNTYRGSNAYYF